MKRKNRKEDTDENKADLELLSVSSIDSSVDNSVVPSNQEE